MPIDYSLYPADWKQIRAAILARSGNACEHCGVANYAVGWRDKGGEFYKLSEDNGHLVEPENIIRIVLTVAHLDHDITSNEPSNLRALCQQCHLRHDASHHARNAAITRRRRKVEAGQVEIEF